MLIRFNEAERIENPEGSIWDYALPSEDVGVSFQELRSRGPKTGSYLNKVCHEIYFITKGSAVFHVGDKVYEVNQKDLVVVEPGTKHHIETAHLEYITITRPNWYEGQYENVK